MRAVCELSVALLCITVSSGARWTQTLKSLDPQADGPPLNWVLILIQARATRPIVPSSRLATTPSNRHKRLEPVGKGQVEDGVGR